MFIKKSSPFLTRHISDSTKYYVNIWAIWRNFPSQAAVENSPRFSTAESLKKKVFHKVIHIIHRWAAGILWKKREKFVFLGTGEKP